MERSALTLAVFEALNSVGYEPPSDKRAILEVSSLFHPFVFISKIFPFKRGVGGLLKQQCFVKFTLFCNIVL